MSILKKMAINRARKRFLRVVWDNEPTVYRYIPRAWGGTGSTRWRVWDQRTGSWLDDRFDPTGLDPLDLRYPS